MSPRDLACLSTLLTLRGSDGWTSAPRARLLERSGLTWSTWRRAVGSLVVAQLLEERPGVAGASAVSSSYRVTAQGEERLAAAQPGPGPAQVSGPGRPTSSKTPEPLRSSSLEEEKEEKEDPEELGRAAQPGPDQSDLADALRYFADSISEALAGLTLALMDARSGDRAATPSTSAPRSRQDRGAKDSQGWSGHDCEGKACPVDASHGTLLPSRNGKTGAWYAWCTVDGCSGRFNPGSEQRKATPPDKVPRQAQRSPASAVDVGSVLGALAGLAARPLAPAQPRPQRRDPRVDPRPGDVVESGRIARRVTLASASSVAFTIIGKHLNESHTIELEHWRRWAREGAEVRHRA